MCRVKVCNEAVSARRKRPILTSNQRMETSLVDEPQGYRSVEDGATELLNEPELSIVHTDALELADAALARPTLGNSVARALEADGEVHTENTSGGVVLNSEINMLVDTEAEVA